MRLGRHVDDRLGAEAIEGLGQLGPEHLAAEAFVPVLLVVGKTLKRDDVSVHDVAEADARESRQGLGVCGAGLGNLLVKRLLRRVRLGLHLGDCLFRTLSPQNIVLSVALSMMIWYNTAIDKWRLA